MKSKRLRKKYNPFGYGKRVQRLLDVMWLCDLNGYEYYNNRLKYLHIPMVRYLQIQKCK